MARVDGRGPDQLRPVRIVRNYTKPAEGSVLIVVGDTEVICTASVEDRQPRYMREQNIGNKGWGDSRILDVAAFNVATDAAGSQPWTARWTNTGDSAINLVERCGQSLISRPSASVQFGSIAMSFKRMAERAPHQLRGHLSHFGMLAHG